METFKDFIDMFNEITVHKYRPIASYEHAFKARLKDGFTFEEMRQAVQNAANHPFLRGENPGKKDYLTPEYILRPNKLQEWIETKGKPLIGSQSYYD